MTRPQRFFFRMLLFLLAVFAAGSVVFEPLKNAFLANAPLNGLIAGVFLIGVIYSFRQVLTLTPEVNWIEEFRKDNAPISETDPPRLLAPMAAMLGGRKDEGLRLSALSTRSLLDGIASRLDESRDISRYTMGLLIFLGLLGTFWGLLDTVGSIRNVIAGLSPGDGGVTDIFAELKNGLEAPLAGMGTAFSSSLFGLAGSLVLGFLDLQTGQAQNRFFTELEDWLSSLTRLSSGTLSGGDGGDQTVPAYVEALLEQTAESLENLQRTLTRGEESRIQSDKSMMALSDRLSTLSDFMQTEQLLMKKLAEAHLEMRPILAKLADGGAHTGGGGMDEATRIHIRNLDTYVARLVEETAKGRDDIVSQLRSEIKLLARTLASTSDEA